jgi:2-oxoglutarate dehydrogenase E1 component
MGAWSFVSPEIERVMGEAGCRQPRLTYSGRPASASPATGLLKRHVKEQAQLVADALGLTVA